MRQAETQFADQPLRLRLARFVSNRPRVMARVEAYVEAELDDNEGRDPITGKIDWSKVDWVKVMQIVIMFLTALGVF